jgi:formate-dependent nitrite reductase cytochrome c552 subunit
LFFPRHMKSPILWVQARSVRAIWSATAMPSSSHRFLSIPHKWIGSFNPATMPGEIRDDVCAQCHFLGDARVLQPGKNALDFRPGTPLDKVVAIFSVPAKVKGDRFSALDQFEQLRLSRCAIASKGRLGCISCHDPHVQLRGAEAAEDFRKRCLTCHKVESCRAPFARRQSTSPPDSCVTCHMPKQQLENISHARQGTPLRTPATYYAHGVSNCFGISAIVPHRK